MNRKQFLLTLFSPILVALEYKQNNQLYTGYGISPLTPPKIRRGRGYTGSYDYQTGIFYCPHLPLN